MQSLRHFHPVTPNPNPSLQGIVDPGNPSPVQGLNKGSSPGISFRVAALCSFVWSSFSSASSSEVPQHCLKSASYCAESQRNIRGVPSTGHLREISSDGVQFSQLSHSGLWLCRHHWCSSALCPQPKGHSGFPTSCFPTILNAEAHFIRSRMPRSGTHLKCR